MKTFYNSFAQTIRRIRAVDTYEIFPFKWDGARHIFHGFGPKSESKITTLPAVEFKFQFERLNSSSSSRGQLLSIGNRFLMWFFPRKNTKSILI